MGNRVRLGVAGVLAPHACQKSKSPRTERPVEVTHDAHRPHPPLVRALARTRHHPPCGTRRVPGGAVRAYSSMGSVTPSARSEACGRGERRVGCRGVHNQDRMGWSRINEDRHGEHRARRG